MRRVFTYSALVLANALPLFTSCQTVCEDEDSLPQYTLSAGQRAWTDSFAPGTIWRFRNAAGYERTYRIDTRNTDMVGSGGGKSSFCSSYYMEEVGIRFARTDSVAQSQHMFYLTAKSASPISASEASISWGAQSFVPPIDQAETTGAGLATYTFNGRTYTQVLEVNGKFVAQIPTMATRLYLTKTDGIIRFEDKNGTVWDRI